jgi:multiple sugar transport system substrate-binding protein
MAWRRWTALAIVACVALVAGCGGPAAGSGGGSSGKIKLVYFNARGGEAAERKLIDRYQQENPNIEIDYQASTSISAPSDSDAISNLIFNIQAGTVVDIAKVEVTRTPTALMPVNAAKELTAIGGQAVNDRLGQLLNNNLTQIKGGVWALPYEYDPFGYVYNADMFRQAGLDPAQPPKTWDDLRAVNTALKAAFPDSWPICHPINNLSKIQPIVWGAGGTYFDQDVLPTKADFTNPGARAGYAFLREWAQKGWMNSEEVTGQTAVQWMVAQQCAALDYSTSLIVALRANDPDTDWRSAPIVSADASHQMVNFAGGSALIIPSTAAHPKEAMDFMLWLTDVEAQRLKYGVDPSLGLAQEDIADQSTPANRTVASDPALAEDPLWKDAINQTPPRTPGISPVYSQIYQILADMQERIIRTNNDLDTELQNAQAASQKLLDANVAQMPSLYQS